MARLTGSLTISALLLGTLLLVLVSSIALYSHQLSQTTTTLARLQSVMRELDSTEFGLRSLQDNAGVRITFDGFNVSLRQNLSNLSNYRIIASRFASFASSAARPANLTLDTVSISGPVFFLRPSNISINYTAAGLIAIRPPNPSTASNITGYDLLARLNSPALNPYWANQSTLSNSSPDAIYLHIGMQGTNGTFSQTIFLNRSAYSELQMRDASNHSQMTLQLQAPSALSIYYDLALDADLDTNLLLSERNEVELGTNVINVTYDVEQIGTVVWRAR